MICKSKSHILLSLAWLLVSCKAIPHEPIHMDPLISLQQAQKHLEQGQFYQARKLTTRFLEEYPDNKEAQTLMAEILNQEIAWQKEALEPKAREEFSNTEKQRESRTWLERSRSLMELKQYDQAMEAAEKVFIYDPHSLEASKLMDQIRQSMRREGKSESHVVDEMRREEIQQRVERYRYEAKRAIATDHWGIAKHAIEKLLILLPNDAEALRLQELIEAHLSQEGP